MAHSGEPAIEIKDVHKYFGAFRALSDVTATVQRGEITGILGPSGSGLDDGSLLRDWFVMVAFAAVFVIGSTLSIRRL